MHDTFGVTVVKGLKNFIDIEPDIIISKALIERPKINITGVNVLHNKSWSLGHRISYNINQIDNVYPTSKCLKDFDFTSNLSLFDWLQNFNDDSFVIQSVNTLVDF